MGLVERNSDRRAVGEDLKYSRPLPTLENSELLSIGEKELTEDPRQNRLALKAIVKEYEEYFALEDRIHAMIGPEVETAKKVDEVTMAWQDIRNLKRIVAGAKVLLEKNFTQTGKVSAENLRDAHALTIACQMFAQRNIDAILEIIIEQEDEIMEIKKTISILSVETKEPEILEEVEIYGGAIEVCRIKIEDEKEKLALGYKLLRYSIQASNYVTGLLVYNPSN